LWENHLKALSYTSKPWIKFIQADDYLLAGGLAKMAAAADNDVSVVWANPTFLNDFDQKIWYFYTLSQPRRLKSHETVGLLMRIGWVLGTPSMMLLRAGAIERDPQVWRSTSSADLIVGSIAAARGDTVLLPAGAIAAVCHERQDIVTQGPSLALHRTVESLKYLHGRPEPDIRRLSAGFTGTAIILWARNLLAAFARGQGDGRSDIQNYLRLIADLDSASWLMVISNLLKVLSAVQCAWLRRHPISIDRFFQSAKKAKVVMLI
jgi:hypothetical protein